MSPFLNECNGKISMYNKETAHLLPCAVHIFILENNVLTALLVLMHKALSSDTIRWNDYFYIRRMQKSIPFLCCYTNVQKLGVNQSMFC